MMSQRTPVFAKPLQQDQTPRLRSLTIGARQVDVDVEPLTWDSLDDIAAAGGYRVGDLVARIDALRGPMDLAEAIFLFTIHYFRLAATADDLEDCDDEDDEDLGLAAASPGARAALAIDTALEILYQPGNAFGEP